MIEPAVRPSRVAGFRRFVPLLVLLAGLVLAYVMGWQRYLSLSFLAESRDTLRATVVDNYVLSIAGYAVFYTLAVAFSIPAAAALSVFSGFLFGWFVGGLVVAFAATAGATIIFLAARSAFGDSLRKRVSGRVARLAEGFEKDAFSYLLVLRLAPVFPFFVINIAPALFNVRLGTYVAATLIGILPGTFAYTYLGEGLDSVLAAAREAGTEVSVADLVTPQITLAFIALAAVAAIPPAIRWFRGTR